MKLLQYLQKLWHQVLAFFRRKDNSVQPGTSAESPREEPVSVIPQNSPRIKIAALPAHNGDTLMIGFEDEHGKSRYIWIDGGLVKSYREHHRDFLRRMHQANTAIDLMIITHIDQDHIGGILAFCNDEEFPKNWIRQFWFNSGIMLANYFKTPHDLSRAVMLPDEGEDGEKSRSLQQGISLEEFLTQNGNWHNQPIAQGQEFQLGGARITVLSPSREKLIKLNEEWQEEMESTRAIVTPDYDQPLETLAQNPEKPDRSIPNGSSIAFLFEYGGKSFLLLGDAHSEDVAKGLRNLGYSEENRLSLDLVKLSHHGSKASNTSELLNLIDCQQFLISTDGSRHGLPNKEAMARIILHPKRKKETGIVFFFNHDNETLRNICSQEEMQNHNFQCIFPENQHQGIELNWGYSR